MADLSSSTTTTTTATTKKDHHHNHNDNNQHALYHHPGDGPTFSQGSDLHNTSQPSLSTVSHAVLGRSYTCPAGTWKTAACKRYLAGSANFGFEDYEVFVVSTT